MAVHVLHCDVCGEAFAASRRHARTCSPRCRQKVYRTAHKDEFREELRDELREIALQLVRDGAIDGATALAYVIHPSPGLLEALYARREQVAA